MICHLFDQILVIFGHFWSILGRSGVREGLARWWRDPAKGSWEPGRVLGEVRAEVGEGSGSDFGHFGPRGQNLRVRGQIFGLRVGFWPFWAILGILGVLASDPTQIAQGSDRDFHKKRG